MKNIKLNEENNELKQKCIELEKKTIQLAEDYSNLLGSDRKSVV